MQRGRDCGLAHERSEGGGQAGGGAAAERAGSGKVSSSWGRSSGAQSRCERA
jgi:hypothetical protein